MISSAIQDLQYNQILRAVFCGTNTSLQCDPAIDVIYNITAITLFHIIDLIDNMYHLSSRQSSCLVDISWCNSGAIGMERIDFVLLMDYLLSIPSRGWTVYSPM